ncbi:MAG: ribosome biogenesis GTP-binding protein YihA/YsxC [Bulleidia sp.]|nr:ribosome biogenesis GTP-binding protein YihA/YsxC [Bulleidia sp.]
MKSHSAELLATAAWKSQWPVSELPEIIFAGRSNAGKSSLINALTNRSQLAYTGSTPGKTVLLNFFRIDDKVVFTDAPGYGYAKGGTKRVVDFAALLDPYFRERAQLKGLILVLDIRRIPDEDDLTMLDYARKAHLACLVVCVKADKLSRNQQINQIKKISQVLSVPQTSLLPVSSTKKTGLDEVWDRIDQLVQR